jgi:23S rRNA (uridine2552-2'-O)-methyltransferase
MAKTTDRFYRQAKADGFAARSVFKLEELDSKFRLFRPGQAVLDLGAAPGSWMQYVSEKVGEAGRVVAVDRNAIRTTLPGNCTFLQADVLSLKAGELGDEFDLVISDLAPQTTGNREGDHARSVELCRKALELARALLADGGSFVCKMYQWEESRGFLEELRKDFKTAKTQKPKASRAESREMFFVGIGFASTSSAAES